MSDKTNSLDNKHSDTLIAHAGRDPSAYHGVVNPPVVRTSTILHPTVEEWEKAKSIRTEHGQYVYGRIGTPLTEALEDAVAALEGGDRAITTSSGLGAVTTALYAFLKAGDHALVADTVYGPARKAFDTLMVRAGVAVTFYDPCIGSDIKDLMQPETRVVYCESPGSLTFEVQDIPAISKVAHAHGAVVMMDNTWASPLYFKAFDHGVDVSIHAGTKYIVGHSDAMLGLVVVKQQHYDCLKQTAIMLGQCAGTEELYLGHRGFRTLSVRMPRHFENGMVVAEWLAGHEDVTAVLHPAMANDTNHKLWKRDFLGASGLFSFITKHVGGSKVGALIDDLELFGIGASWGGYESLVMPASPAATRTATKWGHEGQLVRLHIGLESPDDLINDLKAGFERARKVS